ncbi:MAG: YaaA family protein [Erysipelotrichaceae bacterium]|nr:YaaA family protein [Erysipelotrichaceae bacterium]
MAPTVFEDGYFEYIQQHLRILSAFYGFLKPMDEITPYRLEMEAKADMLYKGVRDEKGIIINLASKEYSKCIERCLSEEDTYIFITFCELSAGKLVTKGAYAKMARGEMIRFMTENCIENP